MVIVIRRNTYENIRSTDMPRNNKSNVESKNGHVVNSIQNDTFKIYSVGKKVFDYKIRGKSHHMRNI